MFKGVNTFASSLSHPSEGVTGKRKKVTPKEIGCKIEVIYSRLLALASDSTNPVYLPPPFPCKKHNGAAWAWLLSFG